MLRPNIRLYYHTKFLLPRTLQIILRRLLVMHRLRGVGHVWPIDERTATPPPHWAGWPQNKSFALVLTHDVEGPKGHDRCLRLAELEEKLGFRSVFNFVAQDYPVSSRLREELTSRGFEVGVHGLTHDGSLYRSRQEFQRQAALINGVLKEWNAVGFRSPSMHHNLNWLQDLDIEYDASTFDTDPFEPQPDSLHSIFPMVVARDPARKGYVEIPYTLPQDFTLFVLMREKSIDTWQKKLRWIARKGGLALLNTHPDYMHFGKGRPALGEYPAELYENFLRHVRQAYEGNFWHVLPRELARFWRANYRAESDAGENLPIPKKQESVRVPSEKHSPSMGCRPSNPARHPMKACMVAYTFYETDNRVKRYAETLARQGAQVDVIALYRNDQGPFEVQNGVRIHRIQKRVVDEKGPLTYIQRLLAFLWRSFLHVSRNHLKKNYDLIHVHNMPDFLVFGAILPKLSGAKVILDIHDIVPELYASKFNVLKESILFRSLQYMERVCCSFADHVIISNDIWRDRLIKRSVKPEKCTTILNYPDSALFRFHEAAGCREKFTMLYPGTLNSHQGLDIAVRAFALIHERVPHVEFHIYGEGPDKKGLIKLVLGLGLQRKVHFHGFVPLEEVSGLIRRADLGVVPKRGGGFGGEAFSTKILEFMASGVPVIASDTRIDRHYFDESCVRFFRSDDEHDLAEAILDLVQNDSKRKQQATAALDFAARNTWDARQSLYIDVLNRLILNP